MKHLILVALLSVPLLSHAGDAQTECVQGMVIVHTATSTFQLLDRNNKPVMCGAAKQAMEEYYIKVDEIYRKAIASMTIYGTVQE